MLYTSSTFLNTTFLHLYINTYAVYLFSVLILNIQEKFKVIILVLWNKYSSPIICVGQWFEMFRNKSWIYNISNIIKFEDKASQEHEYDFHLHMW